MAKRKVVEEVEEVLPEPLPTTYPCPWCGGTGQRAVGFNIDTEDPEDYIYEPCDECGGTGTLEGA